MAEFEMFDYVKMQNEMYMNSLDTGLSSPVTVYGDDSEKKILSFWYDEEDKDLVEDSLSNSGGAFVKGYSKDIARDGIQIQSGDYAHLGYGQHSTIHLVRIIALSYLGITLQEIEKDDWYIVPKNDNHLDLHRDNIVVGKDKHEWGQKYRKEMSLYHARYHFTKENTDEETETS